MSIEIITIKNNPVDSNCYLIYDKEINNKCLIVDPGSKDVSLIEREIKIHELIPDLMILTHEHFDHVWGCNQLFSKYGITTYGSPICLENIKSERLNCSRFYDDVGFSVDVPTKPLETDGALFPWNGLGLQFFETPGHSDAGVCFLLEDNLFTGDTLIHELKTVTNILSGSKEKLKFSIEMLTEFQGMDLTVYPGHGQSFALDSYNLDKTYK